MGNFFAYFMLAVWPVVALVITRKKAPDSAVILLFLVPYLILPPAITLSNPITSSLDKYIIPSLVALVIMRAKFGPMYCFSRFFSIRILVLLLAISPFLTFLYNRDPVYLAQSMIPGLTVKDAINMTLFNLCWIFVPFFLGFTWLGDPKSHGKLLVMMSVAGLIYSIPMLLEVRVSPQLNAKIYGFFPSSFDQQIRAGGFRPVVFLEHGLRVAVFFAASIMATIVVCKNGKEKSGVSSRGYLKLAYMFAVVLLCKTWSAAIYAAVAAAIFTCMRPRKWVQFSVVVIAVFFTFPFLRDTHWIPINQVSDFFSQYNGERAGSLQFRFDNEDILLDRAYERPLSGWGGWGRSRIYNDAGKDISVTDGTWIIVFGVSGWIGYIAQFGFIFFPVFWVYRIFSSNKTKEVPAYTAGLFVVLAFNMIDLIPNSSTTPFNYLLAGAIMGYARLNSPCQKPLKRSTRAQAAHQVGLREATRPV